MSRQRTWPFEHVQHALSHEEATTNVDTGNECGGGSKAFNNVRRIVSSTHEYHPANSRDAGDGICHRHKRRVQCWSHTPYSVVACTHSKTYVVNITEPMDSQQLQNKKCRVAISKQKQILRLFILKIFPNPDLPTFSANFRHQNKENKTNSRVGESFA